MVKNDIKCPECGYVDGHWTTCPILKTGYQPRKRVVFEFDERSYESLEEIKRRTGCNFQVIVVRNPETGEQKEVLLPIMPTAGNHGVFEKLP